MRHRSSTSAIPLDEKNENSFGAASKSLALAETLIGLDRPAAAVGAAERGLALETNEFVAVPAARVFAAANHDDRAEELAVALQRREQPFPRAYAHVISGELALRRGHASQAIAAFSDGIKTADIWLARFGRGVAFVEAERYAEGAIGSRAVPEAAR